MMKFNDTAPIYIQIADYLSRNIRDGRWAEGERILSVRELSTLLGVAPNTCVRAYELLTEKGIIAVQRGMGYNVCPGACEKIHEEAKHEFLEVTLFDMINEMKRFGVTIEDFTTVYNMY